MLKVSREVPLRLQCATVLHMGLAQGLSLVHQPSMIWHVAKSNTDIVASDAPRGAPKCTSLNRGWCGDRQGMHAFF